MLLAWQPITIDGSIVEGAGTLQDRERLSWWDTRSCQPRSAPDARTS